MTSMQMRASDRTRGPLSRALVGWMVSLALSLAAAAAARAGTDDMPARAGRVVNSDGRAWVYDTEQRQWADAWRNRALTEGDRVSTDPGARLQLAVGSTELRLDGDTEVDFERLDDSRMVVRVVRGSLALRARNNDVAREIEVRASEVRISPLLAGHYRIDRRAATVVVTAWRGRLDVDTREQRVSVSAGRAIEVYREGRDEAVVQGQELERDAFSDWVARDERADDRDAVSSRYVSPEMTGADELGRYGRWDRHPEYGMVWMPSSVSLDWAPYRQGRWTWHVRWGWTWVDDAPWGFATSHYGRWSHWRGRWVWVPGTYVGRPVFAPALVAWVGSGGSGVGLSLGFGSSPAVGWLPLAPWEVYVPPFRHPTHYFDRVNPQRRPGHHPQVPTGPISYGNHGVPNAVTVVPVDVLRGRLPVAPSVMRDPDLHRRLPREPVHALPPGVVSGGPSRIERVPGGAQPARPPSPGAGGVVSRDNDAHPNRPPELRPPQPGMMPGGVPTEPRPPAAVKPAPSPNMAPTPAGRQPQAVERQAERPSMRPSERPVGPPSQPKPAPPAVVAPAPAPRAPQAMEPQPAQAPRPSRMEQPSRPVAPAVAPAPAAPPAAANTPAPAARAVPERRDGVLKDSPRDGARERRERE